MLKTKQQKTKVTESTSYVSCDFMLNWQLILVGISASICIRVGVSACTSSEKSRRLAVFEMYY